MGEAASGLFSAGGDIGSAFIGANATAQANQANINEENYLAANGIQLKVADAKAAGINPIYALGAPTFSPAETVQPVNVGPGVAAAGQDISRAINSTSSQQDRDYTNKLNSLNLESKKLDVEAKKAYIANMPGNQPQNPPLPAAASRSSHASGQWSGVSNSDVSGYPKGLSKDPDSVYNYYHVPGATQSSSVADLGISPTDISRGLSNWYHMSRLYHMYSGQ